MNYQLRPFSETFDVLTVFSNAGKSKTLYTLDIEKIHLNTMMNCRLRSSYLGFDLSASFYVLMTFFQAWEYQSPRYPAYIEDRLG